MESDPNVGIPAAVASVAASSTSNHRNSMFNNNNNRIQEHNHHHHHPIRYSRSFDNLLVFSNPNYDRTMSIETENCNDNQNDNDDDVQQDQENDFDHHHRQQQQGRSSSSLTCLESLNVSTNHKSSQTIAITTANDCNSGGGGGDNLAEQKLKHKTKSKNAKLKWIYNPMTLINSCFMSRTDSLIDMKISTNSDKIHNNNNNSSGTSSDSDDTNQKNQSDQSEQNKSSNHCKIGQEQQLRNSNKSQMNEEISVSNNNAENAHNDDDDDDNDDLDDDDLLFMDHHNHHPNQNQSINRRGLVQSRRSNRIFPGQNSPEPPPLPPHPYPIGLPGFIYNDLPPTISSSSSSSSSSPNHLSNNNNADDNDNILVLPRSNNINQNRQRINRNVCEPYPYPSALINGSIHNNNNPNPNNPNNNNNHIFERALVAAMIAVTTPIHTQIDYINRLVPDLLAITNCSFYWGKMDRYEAERLLEGKPEGTFLLRDSAQEDHLFSVSFRRFDRSLHARIENLEHRFSFDSHDPGVFSSTTVTGLIEHYKDPTHIMFFEPILTKPLNRTFTFSLQHLARVTICDRIEYDTINHLPLPPMLKVYLKEYHYRVKVRTRHYDGSVLAMNFLQNNEHNEIRMISPGLFVRRRSFAQNNNQNQNQNQNLQDSTDV